MSERSRRSRWMLTSVVVVIAAVLLSAFVFEYYQFSSTRNNSTSNSTAKTGSKNTRSNSTSSYPSPEEACANLPQNAIGIYTADPNASSVYILIVEADIGSSYEGINGSAFHQNTNWPVITVYQGQKVTMHVVNCPSSPEPHGFAIGHYFPNGVELSPNQQYTLSFVASTKGRFTVFCNVYCAIHPLMQNGELLVK